jgi:PleD family two-component response regulator
MPSNFNNINALVIDTNSSMRQIMVSMLRAMGMNSVIVANSESQCISLIATESINLVVCGWTLPKLNALSILKKVRDNDKTIQLPFIIISTMIEQDQIKQAIAHGVSEYLVPPFNKQIFEQRISKAVKIPIQSSAKNIANKINAKRFVAKKDNAELNVLIVDDVADNIEIISALIKGKYRVKAALNAKSAMKICLSDSPPDLLLLDIMMPEVDGLTFCKQLKQNPLTQNIVIIFLTALSETSDIVTGLSLGAVDYITKPIIPEILMARLDVHTTLILNQRAIQKQIDKLLEQNTLNARYQHEIQSEFSDVLQVGNEALAAINHIVRAKQQLIQPIKELEYTLGMSRLIIDNSRLFEQLEQGHYQTQRKRVELNGVLLSSMDIFDAIKLNKNIERFESIPYNTHVNCDVTLLTTMFSCLYKNALESAPRGSKVSVTGESHPHFALIAIHNVGEIDEVGKENTGNFTEKLDVNDPTKSANIGVYLAYLAIEALQGELYYHSSIQYGTQFYIKLPI